MYRGLDGKYIEEFNYDTSKIVTISNYKSEINYELFSNLFHEPYLCILPLTYLVTYGRVGCLQIENTIIFFEDIDDSFEKYLGIQKCYSEKDAVQRIHQLLNKENDGMHKYYVFGSDPMTPFGLFYIYNYKEKYKTCDIGIGISKEYRGKGICFSVIDIICKQLLQQGINRIGLEVEDTNIRSIALCEKKLTKIGFKYEGIKRNSYGTGINSLVFSKIRI